MSALNPFNSMIPSGFNAILSETEDIQDIVIRKMIRQYIHEKFYKRGYGLKYLIGMIKNENSAYGLKKEYDNIIIGGDFNIIPNNDDVYNFKKFEDDALYRLQIRKKFREIINLGFHDAYRHINSNKQEYTFWDYMSGAWQKNNGMRIDHFLITSSLISNLKNVKINKYPRGKIKPSDHTPIEIEIN